jgi:serine/threonine protein kinase
MGGTLERFQDRPANQREPNELVGPYLLLAEIGRGDLNTVYLAKKHAALGLQRLYALKRLKPAHAHNADSVELLLDEARLVSGIHHANIAGVLDVGNDAGNYTVMEYVEGENLEALLARAGTARHPRFTVPAFVDALHGLHALHTATDADGESYGIVHQAPRARHIVVGVDGTSRLVDFSQVRGRYVRPTRSRSDRIKVAYMAPEQALHPDGVDLRSDLFIIGVALWEALTGERLFGADTDEQSFQNMLHRRIPRPSEVGLRPPRCFDAICMRALERAPKNRYPSAQEMARDLHDTAINQALYATASELGQWVRQLAGSDLRGLRKLAGQDYPSGSISLETPVVGIDVTTGKAQVATTPARGLARLSDGLVALQARNEHERTPAAGFHGDKPLRREEEEDDDVTGPRQLAPAQTADERARAATEPQSTAAQLAGASVAARGSAREQGQSSMDANDATAAFIPARPGARKDVNRPSPGAYSQVDGSRRAKSPSAAVTELEIPTAKVLLLKDKVVKEASAFDEADTTVHPQLAPKEESQTAPGKRAETKTYQAAHFSQANAAASSGAGVERRGPITEHPPTYVQRRDSSPTRMEMPDGPVGNPHRSLTPDERMAAASASGAGTPAMRSVRSANPFDLPPLSPGEGGLPDSLSPPRTAQRTAPPLAPEPAPRPSALWLVSGVLAAIILLALGVGLKQWVAGGPPPRARVSHAASGRSVTSEAASEARLRAEPPPSPALGDARALDAPLGAGASPALPAPSEVPSAAAASRSAADLVLPRGATPAPAVGAHASEQGLEPKPSRSAKKQSAKAVSSEPARARRERAVGSLPDNPY